MKKVLVVALSALIALSFCAVASAGLVGHVGHIDKSSYVPVDTGDIVCTPSYDDCFCIDLLNVNVDESNVNMDGEGTWTLTLLSGEPSVLLHIRTAPCRCERHRARS